MDGLLRANQLAIRYVLISAIALLIDLSSYYLLNKYNVMGVSSSAALSYFVGMFAAYFLMTTFVFNTNLKIKKSGREFGAFFGSGLLGIFITYMVSSTYLAFFNDSWVLSKLCAVIASFLTVFFIRKNFVFHKRLHVE